MKETITQRYARLYRHGDSPEVVAISILSDWLRIQEEDEAILEAKLLLPAEVFASLQRLLDKIEKDGFLWAPIVTCYPIVPDPHDYRERLRHIWNLLATR